MLSERQAMETAVSQSIAAGDQPFGEKEDKKKRPRRVLSLVRLDDGRHEETRGLFGVPLGRSVWLDDQVNTATAPTLHRRWLLLLQSRGAPKTTAEKSSPERFFAGSLFLPLIPWLQRGRKARPGRRHSRVRGGQRVRRWPC